jgi:hypothetical protein
LASPVGVILPSERDVVALHGDQSAIADSDPMGVASQVHEHLLRPAEGWLGVDDPFGPDTVGEPSLEFSRVGHGAELAVKGQPPPVEGGPEQREQFAAEDAAEDADRQEKPRPAGDPSRGVGGDPAAGGDAVDMGVMLEVLVPGVEDGEEADLGPEVVGAGGDLLQGLRGGAEEQAVDHARVRQGDRVERRRQGEDEVEIFDGQQFRLAGLHPVGGGGGLALGAVAVAAGVVGDLAVAALIAFLDVAAQFGGPADGDIMEDETLFVGEPGAVAIEEGIAVSSEDVGDFEPWPGHGRVSPGRVARRSSGLWVASTAAGETWV